MNITVCPQVDAVRDALRLRSRRCDGHDHERRAHAGAIAALLVGLTMKGERPAEIAGIARTMRAIHGSTSQDLHDVFDVRYGRRSFGTFHISSAAALVAASAGLRVANMATGPCRASVAVPMCNGPWRRTSRPRRGYRAVARNGRDRVLFAPTFHPSMRHATPVRRELGVRTAFNLLGPLTNPAGARRQLVGVPHAELTELIARSLLMLGSERAWVVHGADGTTRCRRRGTQRCPSAGTGRSRRLRASIRLRYRENRPRRAFAAAMPPAMRRSCSRDRWREGTGA